MEARIRGIRRGSILFKGCPKCRGDMHLLDDPFGAYLQCIQCGLIQEEAHPAAGVSSVQRKAA